MANNINEQEELEISSLSLYETALKISVVDAETYKAAAEFCRKIKIEKKKRTDFFKPLKDAAHKAHKAISAKEKETISPLIEADEYIRNKCITPYLDEQERIQKEKQAEEERKAKVKADKDRKDLEARAAKAKKPETIERLEEKIEEVFAEPVIVEHEVKKTAHFASGGSVTRKKDIEVSITDQKEFLKAIIDSIIPMTCVEFKPNNVKRWIKASGKEEDTIPGCHIKKTSRTMIR